MYALLAGFVMVITGWTQPALVYQPAPHLTRVEATRTVVFASSGLGLPREVPDCARVAGRPDLRVCRYRDGERARVREMRHHRGYVVVPLDRSPLDIS